MPPKKRPGGGSTAPVPGALLAIQVAGLTVEPAVDEQEEDPEPRQTRLASKYDDIKLKHTGLYSKYHEHAEHWGNDSPKGWLKYALKHGALSYIHPPPVGCLYGESTVPMFKCNIDGVLSGSACKTCNLSLEKIPYNKQGFRMPCCWNGETIKTTSRLVKCRCCCEDHHECCMIRVPYTVTCDEILEFWACNKCVTGAMPAGTPEKWKIPSKATSFRLIKALETECVITELTAVDEEDDERSCIDSSESDSNEVEAKTVTTKTVTVCDVALQSKKTFTATEHELKKYVKVPGYENLYWEHSIEILLKRKKISEATICDEQHKKVKCMTVDDPALSIMKPVKNRMGWFYAKNAVRDSVQTAKFKSAKLAPGTQHLKKYIKNTTRKTVSTNAVPLLTLSRTPNPAFMSVSIKYQKRDVEVDAQQSSDESREYETTGESESSVCSEDPPTPAESDTGNNIDDECDQLRELKDDADARATAAEKRETDAKINLKIQLAHKGYWKRRSQHWQSNAHRYQTKLQKTESKLQKTESERQVLKRHYDRLVQEHKEVKKQFTEEKKRRVLLELELTRLRSMASDAKSTPAGSASANLTPKPLPKVPKKRQKTSE